MHLKLEELQQVVKKTIKEERIGLALREELYKVLGPSIVVSNNIERISEAANEQLDVMEATGREPDRLSVKLSVLAAATKSRYPSVRKVAARLLPERLASKLLMDPSSSVRCAAAARLPYAMIKEAVRRYPGDDQLRTIARSKKLHEAGIPTPKPQEEHFDMYGEEPLGDAVATPNPLKDLPDTWYERIAQKLCKEYGTNLEGQWEEILATRVAASYYATSGVRIDRDKLLKCIYDCLKERDDAVLGEGSLRAIAARLRESSHLDDAVMPVLEEQTDPIETLLESDVSTSEYVSRTEEIFSIKKSTVPAGIKKYRLGEGLRETQIPVKGQIPGTGRVTPTVEKALDRYVDAWNKQQSMNGEPYRLSWGPNGAGIDLIGFNLELK